MDLSIFVLKIFQITKSQYTVSCNERQKFQGKISEIIQNTENFLTSKYLGYTLAS